MTLMKKSQHVASELVIQGEGDAGEDKDSFSSLNISSGCINFFVNVILFVIKVTKISFFN